MWGSPMTKINPLYLFAFFLFMALLMIYQSARLETKIVRQAETNAQTQTLGKRIASLKQQWKAPGEAQKRIDAVLGLKTVAPKVKTRQKEAGVYKVVVADLSAGELDKLCTKLLNEALPVKSLTLTRNGDKSVTAAWEFAL